MRVGLNATCFNDRPSGANQRFAGIYGTLISRCPDIEFVVYEPMDCRVGEWFGRAPNVTVRPTPLISTSRLRRAVGGLIYWKSALRRDRLDLFEAFHLPLIRAPDCPTVVTVHDARPLLEVSPARRLIGRHVLEAALRDADHVVTVSQTMRAELLDIEPTARVTSVYNGIDPEPFQVSTDRSDGVARRLNLPGRFMLAVGHLEARKNYLRLVEALACLRQLDCDYSLVIVGNDGGDGDNIRTRVAALGLEESVRLLSGVSNEDLAHIYALSELVVFPSTYEGFGIPVLEAMAANRPLVLSDIAVFRELTESRGCYFDPLDSQGIAVAMRAFSQDAGRQRELVEYGRTRIRDFGFARLAAQVEGIYRRLLETGARPELSLDAPEPPG